MGIGVPKYFAFIIPPPPKKTTNPERRPDGRLVLSSLLASRVLLLAAFFTFNVKFTRTRTVCLLEILFSSTVVAVCRGGYSNDGCNVLIRCLRPS